MKRVWGSLTINFKSWEGGRGPSIEQFVDRMGLSRSLCLVEEANGEFRGSGSAILNCLSREAFAGSDDQPSIVILAAGEGSRLWGVSISLGFVKGLLNVASKTLIELSALQGVKLINLLPSPTSQYVFITGSDNYIEIDPALPAVADKAACAYYFSIPFKVIDEQGSVDDQMVSKLMQLGIMFVNSNQEPVFFRWSLIRSQSLRSAIFYFNACMTVSTTREKPSQTQILEMLELFQADTVFVNAFCFAFSKQACQTLLAELPQSIWSKPFDWSGHVLTPLALQHGGVTVDQWMSDAWLSPKQRQTFSDKEWRRLWTAAGRFLDAHGAPRVISLRSSRWYDVGLCSDLMRLYGTLPEQRAVNCFLAEGVELPSGTIAIDSTLHAVTGGGEGVLLYRVQQTRESPPLHLEANMAYFSYEDTAGVTRIGRFPVDVNPKLGNHLEHPIEGIGLSFRQVQEQNGVQLDRILF